MDPALASQIYGKDLEALQGEAAEALSESERAKIAAGEADEQYVAQLDASKKEYEEQFEDEDRKAKLLGMTPEELKGVTQKEAEELFGKDMADRLFDFKDGYISDAQLSKTREILQKNLAAKKELKTKAETDKDTAIANKEKQFTDIEKEVFGDVDNPGAISTFKDINQQQLSSISGRLEKVKEVLNSRWRRNWGGISKDSWILNELQQRALDAMKEQTRVRREMETARTTKDTAKMKSLLDQYRKYIQQRVKEDATLYDDLSPTAKRL